ncbi:MAG: hypothetical protein FI734_08190 [SAR202 cluster bacterium]|nr:hypothetical protein [SAR202 cluster bacterium]|tara:strand:- start:7427 stop:7771 length:345 start_codon:yes stop_codon:yes gene_type:complete
MSENEQIPDYNERELAEIDELNRLSDSKTQITQSKLWKRLTTFVAAIIVLSLLLPIVVLILAGNDGRNEGKDSTLTTIPVPDFELIDTDNNRVRLSTELGNNSIVILLFYRGFF